MQKTTLEQWRMFQAVVEHGGFNQAAQQIHKSQSSIHHAVGKLEQSLEIKLFEIQGRRALLTEAGELLLRRSRYLLDEVARIESVATHLRSEVESELAIAVDGAFPQTLVYQALESVSQQYPQLKIDLVDTVLSGANEYLREGDVNIAVSPQTLDNGLNDEICQIDFIAVAHHGHPLLQMTTPINYDDLKSHRQIIVRDSAIHTKTSAGWQGADQRWTVSHIRASVDLIAQGLGYAWLPRPAISQLLERAIIKPLPLVAGANRRVSFYLNYQDRDTLGPAAREFMGQLRQLTLTPS